MRLFKTILLLATISLLAACGKPSSPEFMRMEDVKFGSVSFSDGLSVVLNGNAVFDNPNKIGANISSVDLDMYVNGKKVTHINQEVHTTMPANAEFKLPLTFNVPLKEVFKDAKPTLGDIFNKRKIEYRLVGTLKVAVGYIQVEVPIDHEDVSEVKLSM